MPFLKSNTFTIVSAETQKQIKHQGHKLRRIRRQESELCLPLFMFKCVNMGSVSVFQCLTLGVPAGLRECLAVCEHRHPGHGYSQHTPILTGLILSIKWKTCPLSLQLHWNPNKIPPHIIIWTSSLQHTSTLCVTSMYAVSLLASLMSGKYSLGGFDKCLESLNTQSNFGHPEHTNTLIFIFKGVRHYWDLWESKVTSLTFELHDITTSILEKAFVTRVAGQCHCYSTAAQQETDLLTPSILWGKRRKGKLHTKTKKCSIKFSCSFNRFIHKRARFFHFLFKLFCSAGFTFFVSGTSIGTGTTSAKRQP